MELDYWITGVLMYMKSRVPLCHIAGVLLEYYWSITGVLMYMKSRVPLCHITGVFNCWNTEKLGNLSTGVLEDMSTGKYWST